MTAYIALIRKNPGSDCGVDFPDLPGCVTAGRTLDEARRMAAGVLAVHMEEMIEDREAIPEPAALDAILADPHRSEAVAFLVDVAARPSRSIRINVTLPGDLVEQIDRHTRNRSSFLADAARAKLEAA